MDEKYQPEATWYGQIETKVGILEDDMKELKQLQREDRDKIDGMKNLAITTLVALFVCSATIVGTVLATRPPTP